MSIRMLAVEFYRSFTEAEELERKIANLAPGSPDRGDLEGRLKQARAEQARMKKLLEGAKQN